MRPIASPQREGGFSLIEVAVALFIIAIFLGGILVPLTTQVAQRKTSDTQKALEDVKEALIGYAMAHGRLPCPASSTSRGFESFVGPVVGASACTNSYNGFVPAETLGLQATVVSAATLGRPPTDPPQSGYAIDAWGTPIRYAVTTSNNNAFTTFTPTMGMRYMTMPFLTPDLSVCAASPGSGVQTTCNAATVLVSSAPAVIYSLGPNAMTTGVAGVDEAANLNVDQVFVYHVRSDVTDLSINPNGQFDDIVTWLSANALYSRMVSAGQLP
jgi:prepilin-type N-terminal cleavage/methylation domain-containing protein